MPYHDFEKINDLFNRKRIKPPAYQWQEFALRIIKELVIPDSKKSAVFKVCRDYPKNFIEQCLVDTKELSQRAEKWKYFFKLVNQSKTKSSDFKIRD